MKSKLRRARVTVLPRDRKRGRSDVHYPVSDGKPMAESDKHADLMIYCRGALMSFFEDRKNEVYVSGNNFIYYQPYQPGIRRNSVSPDGYVVFGIPQRQRDTYKIWEEGDHYPAVVFEFTSKSTEIIDTNRKLALYEQVLKVPEYFMFDPNGDYITSRLRGYRLVGEKYEMLEVVNNRLYSEQLGLELVQLGEVMRFYDPRRQRFLPTYREAEARAETETRRAEVEAQRADIETLRAEAEAEARRLAESEIERLRAELAALRGG